MVCKLSWLRLKNDQSENAVVTEEEDPHAPISYVFLKDTTPLGMRRLYLGLKSEDPERKEYG